MHLGREPANAGLFHFIVAIGWTGLSFAIAPKLQASSGNMIATGVAYGFLVWLAK